MARQKFLSHLGSDGSNFTDRIDREKLQWRAAAENVGEAFVSSTEANQGLLSSPQHCANIMNPEYQFFGAARANDYWVMLFTK